MKTRNKILVAILVAGISFSAGQYYGGQVAERQVDIKEVIKYKTQTKTITKIVEKPDGTKETIIREDSRSEADIDRVKKIVEIIAKPKWSVSAARAIPNEVYTFQVDRRIFSGIFSGVYARTDGEIGVTLRYEF